MVSRCIVVLALAFLSSTDAIMWSLHPNTQKCLKEELHANVLITGEYEVTQVVGQRVDYIVRDSKGHILSQKESISNGKFTFVTETYDFFEICFISKVSPQHRAVSQDVSLVVKVGIEAKSYEGIGEASKLKPMEVELKRLEDLSEAIVQDFVYMRRSEEAMRNTNESTNSRVFVFSLFSMFCLFGLATWQVLYLRRYFKAKKLIE